ncbi:hypothetical protein QE152_g25604 [Popillia japonica]|uniref:Uncharacterized protein n=1 Tax=Popillia japonica TaxID=7064 RepID=A0AAW1K1L5_POPJA
MYQITYNKTMQRTYNVVLDAVITQVTQNDSEEPQAGITVHDHDWGDPVENHQEYEYIGQARLRTLQLWWEIQHHITVFVYYWMMKSLTR